MARNAARGPRGWDPTVEGLERDTSRDLRFSKEKLSNRRSFEVNQFRVTFVDIEEIFVSFSSDV
jgi:hypothetical protein